jgi:hypothetical protein
MYFLLCNMFSFSTDCRNELINSLKKPQNVTELIQKDEEPCFRSYYYLGLNKVVQTGEKSNDYAKSNIYLLPLQLRITKCPL